MKTKPSWPARGVSNPSRLPGFVTCADRHLVNTPKRVALKLSFFGYQSFIVMGQSS